MKYFILRLSMAQKERGTTFLKDRTKTDRYGFDVKIGGFDFDSSVFFATRYAELKANALANNFKSMGLNVELIEAEDEAA